MFAVGIAKADDSGELDDTLAAMLADPDVDWAALSIELARLTLALVQTMLEAQGDYDDVRDLVRWLVDLSEELDPGWAEREGEES
jgi:hypothetical protein